MLFNLSNWKIRSKILGIVLAVVFVSVTALTAFSYFTISKSTTEATGEEMVEYAHEALQRSADIVARSVSSLEALALSPTIVEVVEAAN